MIYLTDNLLSYLDLEEKTIHYLHFEMPPHKRETRLSKDNYGLVQHKQVATRYFDSSLIFLSSFWYSLAIIGIHVSRNGMVYYDYNLLNGWERIFSLNRFHLIHLISIVCRKCRGTTKPIWSKPCCLVSKQKRLKQCLQHLPV